MRHAVVLIMAAMSVACEKVQVPQFVPDTTEAVDSGVDVTLDAGADSVADVASDVTAVVDGSPLAQDAVADATVLDSTIWIPDTGAVDSAEPEVSTEEVVAPDVPIDPSDDASVVDVDDGMDVEPIADTPTEDADSSTSDVSDGASLALDAASVDDAVDAADADVAESVDAGEFDTDELDAGAPIDVGAACDDGSLCTGDDVIQADGSCVGVPVPCLDAEPCTQDVCWPNVGCKHVWTPGCGGKPCGECPEDLGYSCIQEPAGAACISTDGLLVYIPAGVFRFEKKYAWQIPATQMNPLPMSQPIWIFVHAFLIDRFQPSIAEVKNAMPDDSECNPDYIFGGCYPVCVDCGTCNDEADGPVHLQIGPSCSRDYCSAIGGRVCKSSEWEKAAVGGCSQLGCGETNLDCCISATWPYPWGFASPNCEVRASCGCTFPYSEDPCVEELLVPWGFKSGSVELDRSPFGVYDMGGNGAEVVIPLGYEASGVLDASCGEGDASSTTNVVSSSCLSPYPVLDSSLYRAGRSDWMAWDRSFTLYSEPPYVPPNGPRCCYDLPTTAPQQPTP